MFVYDCPKYVRITHKSVACAYFGTSLIVCAIYAGLILASGGYLHPIQDSIAHLYMEVNPKLNSIFECNQSNCVDMTNGSVAWEMADTQFTVWTRQKSQSKIPAADGSKVLTTEDRLFGNFADLIISFEHAIASFATANSESSRAAGASTTMHAELISQEQAVISRLAPSKHYTFSISQLLEAAAVRPDMLSLHPDFAEKSIAHTGLSLVMQIKFTNVDRSGWAILLKEPTVEFRVFPVSTGRVCGSWFCAHLPDAMWFSRFTAADTVSSAHNPRLVTMIKV